MGLEVMSNPLDRQSASGRTVTKMSALDAARSRLDAALARLDAQDPRLALRFELYHRGMELANGYHELANAAEQRMRFNMDQQARKSRGLPIHSLDQNLLAAMDAGLPDCAGVALGFDRVLMLALDAASIDDVLAFPVERA